MNFHQAQQGLINTKNLLKTHIQLNLSTFIETDKEITWQNRKPGILKGLYYPMEYQYLLDTQQYSYLLSDGSFFQFYYKFDSKNNLKKGRLAYYPTPLSTKESVDELLKEADNALERDDDQLYEHLFNWTEWLEIRKIHPSNTSHIRFDFDSEVKKHCKSHIQLSGVQELRIPANFFPLPLIFVQLCLSMLSTEIQLPQSSMAFEKANIHVSELKDELLHLQCN